MEKATTQQDLLMQLHQAVWKNDLLTVQKLLSEIPTLDINARDRRGNPPLHVAIHFRYFSMVEFLLSKGADPTAKNLAGFVPLHEVVASGNRKMAVMIFLAVSRHFQAEYRKRLPLLLERIERLPDFYMEFTWNLYSWVPLLSRFCPSDVYKIYKRGSSLRVDTTLVSFENLHWVRGNLSFIFCGSDTGRPGDCVLVDWDKKQIDFVMESERALTAEDVMLDVEDLLTWDVSFGKIKVDEMTFAASRGWWASEKHERVGNFNAKQYEFHNVSHHSVSRKSGLAKDKKDKKKKDSFSKSLSQMSGLSLEEKQKRLEELNSRYSFQEYFYGPLPPPPSPEAGVAVKGEGLLYPSEKLVPKRKDYRGTVWLAAEFPRALTDLLPIIQQMVPSEKAYNRIRDFLHTQFPDYGFPVKFDLPVFPTISISAHIARYDQVPARSHSADLFAIPMHFTRVTPQMRHERRKKSQGQNATALNQPIHNNHSTPAVDLSAPPPAAAHSTFDVSVSRRDSASLRQPASASAPSVVVMSPVVSKTSPRNASATSPTPRSHENLHLLADLD